MKNEIKDILTKLEFVQNEKQPLLFEKKIDENTIAYVDFRKAEFKEKGRRFFKTGDKFGDDPDSIPDLKSFKEERDKILQLSSDNKEGRDCPKPPSDDQNSNPAQGVKSPPAPTPNKTVLDELITAYEIDIAEIFGGAGDGKSQTVLRWALDAIAQGKKVLFVDTERGFLRKDRDKLGNSYKYLSNMKGLMDFVKNIPADVDLLIIDSVGYPVLTEWARLGVNEKGNSLTQIIAIKDMIKDWAINNNKVAIVTNQPDSDFGKDKNYVNRPFGDKGQFVIKEVFKIERIESSINRTKSVLKVFRSRYDARDVIVAHIEITNDGVKIT